MVAGTTRARAGSGDESVSTPREIYNEGTRKLKDGKLREAEAMLQSAAGAMDERVQVAALYNLGQVRFKQGEEELTNAPDNRVTGAAAARASTGANDAIQKAAEALAGEDVQTMLEAYMRGRGARKDLKGAMEAVKHAMEEYGAVLAKWRRASGDFKSSQELNPSDAAARTNADRVDRQIAQLVDRQKLMMPSQSDMQVKKDELGKKMEELKKKLPQEIRDQLKNDGGDEDEDEKGGNGEKPPKEPKPGQEEERKPQGNPRMLTAEEAERLLGMLRLDANRKLLLDGFEQMAKPQDHKGRDW
jgi:hypothetical protein